MIDRLLPLVAAATSRMPLGMRRAYGDLSNRVLDSSSVYGEMRASIAQMGSALIDFSRPPRGPEEQRLHAFAACVRPWTSADLALERVGGLGDGAYVMASGIPASAAVSVGVGHDVSWDAAMARRGTAVWMFDPTVAAPPADVPGGHFLPIGLGDPSLAVGDLAGCDLRALPDLLRIAGLSDRDDLILKVDVEGAEWEALGDADFRPFRQVLIEMHDLGRLEDEDHAEPVLALATSLAATHRAIHIHANNEGRFRRFDRIWFPEVVEVSYVRRDLIPDAVPATHLRSDLDRPSNPNHPDYDLSGILTAAA